MSKDDLFSISDVPNKRKQSVKSCQCIKQCKQSRDLLYSSFLLV